MNQDRSKILVVDDEPFVRKLVRRMLDRDYDIVEAQDGAEAVDMARKHDLDLILMDMMMPKMDGLSACYALKQDSATKDIPVVMLTAITHELNRRMSENVMGASGYVTKPFTTQELLSAIRPLLSRHETAGSLCDLLEFEDDRIGRIGANDGSHAGVSVPGERTVELKHLRKRKQRVKRPGA